MWLDQASSEASAKRLVAGSVGPYGAAWRSVSVELAKRAQCNASQASAKPQVAVD